ncbi:ABC transporter ATP-binding protein [Salsipaludibacter albus]|uniref:ABC transporter ATP-binding protein n=1 Tax=Salsipaludibacter albus TaxID=2849650 RepID=UPI001EE3D4F9|nr:ABC transporter ATP-binding protein [Salsipaludibacter albus]MBY5162138.1 ABC transporter ATP-binding protein [Salsipaludibacter albus]
MRTPILQVPTDARRAPPSADPTAGPPAIRTTAMGKRYDDVVALDHLDLEVPTHAIFGFLGPNGAGKTTAIKLLLGLARPTSGRAQLFGLDSVTDSLAIRARVGYLAQEPRFYDHLTAREVLAFTARFFYRGPTAAVRARIDETLELVGLADKADRPTRGFSGGERQRLGIAQAQVNHPDLLILDEPAAALDPLGRRDVLEVMERLRDRTTIFYSTHILDDVQRVSDHVAILDHGRLVTSAATADLLHGSTTTFDVEVRGDGQPSARALRQRPWVHDVAVTPGPVATALAVTVSDDDEAAEQDLLPTVLAAGATVVRFAPRQFDLEDVFLQLVEGDRS